MKTSNCPSSSSPRSFVSDLARRARKSSAFILSAAGVYILAPHSGALAATLTWDGGGGHPSDAGGTWDSSSTNWWKGSSSAWIDGSAVQFGVGTGGSTPYVVNLGSGFVPTVSGSIAFTNNNYTLSSGTINLGASGTTNITVTAAAATIASSLTGAAGLAVPGTGALTLSGSNNYTGNTTLSAGTLNVNNAGALGSGTLNLNGGTLNNTSGAAITLTANQPITLGGNFTFGTSAGTANNNLNLGTGAVTIAASRTITVAGADVLTIGGTTTNTSTGGISVTVNNGSGATAASGVSFGGFALAGASNQTDTFNGSGNINITGPVINGGAFTGNGLTYAGTGILALSGSNSYTGQTTLSSGSTVLTGTHAGAGTFAVTGGTFKEGATGVIGSGATPLVVAGGSATLSGLNTYTGNTIVATGVLTLDFSSAATPTTAANLIKSGNLISLTGGTLALKGGGAGATNSQTFGSTFLNDFASSAILVNQNNATTVNLTLGALNRGLQSTVDFTLPTSGTITTTASGPRGLIAYASANGGATWATNTNGVIGALGSYSTGNANYLAANNLEVANGDSVSGVTANSLRFNSANETLTLAGANVVNTGILVTPTATGTTSITGGTITSGGPANELTLLNYGGVVNVASAIVNNGSPTSLTIGGTGTTILGGANTFTGNTNLAGGTLSLGGSNLSLASLTGGLNATVALGASGTLTISNGVMNTAAYMGMVTGGTASSIVKNGTGALILNSGGPGNVLNNTSFNGSITVNNGWLVGFNTFGKQGSTGTPIVLGDGSSSNAATLWSYGGNNNNNNPITVKGGGTGALTLIANTFEYMPVTLSNSATLTFSSFGYDYLGGGISGAFANKGSISGTGNVLVQDNAGTVQFYSGAVNMLGSFTAMTLGSGANGAVSMQCLGSNVTALVQASNGGGTLTYNVGSYSAGSSTSGFAGPITVNAGVLSTAMAAATNGAFGNTSTLTMGGGSFQVLSGTNVSRTQVLNGLTLNPGSSTVDADNNVVGGTLTLDLRGAGGTTTITRNAGGTVNFMATLGSFGTTSVVNTHQANDAGGILGGWATVSGNSWAINNGSDVVMPLASYVNLGSATATTNVDFGSTASQSATGLTANTLRFNNAVAGTLTLTGSNVLTDGGILVTPAVGANATLITGGTLTSGNGNDLIVIQNNTNASGAVSIASTIADKTAATALTKSGSGTLYLTNAGNTYTGVTYVNGGILNVAALGNINTASSIGAGSAAGSAGDLVLNSGTLQYTGATPTSTNRSYTLTTAGGGFDASGAGSLTISGSMVVSGASVTQGGAQLLTLSGTGAGTLSGSIVNGAGNYDYTALTKNGAGTWTLSGSNSYTGFTTINAGTLVAANPSALGNQNGTNVVNSALVVMNGGSLDLATDTSINPYNVVMAASSTILSDKATAASSGITQTLGFLTIGNNTLTVNQGANVSGGSPIVAFGQVNLRGDSTISANTANVQINGAVLDTNHLAGATHTLTLTNNTGGVSAILGNISNGGSNVGNLLGGVANTAGASSGGVGGGIVAITKSGTGTWILAGTNSYTGATTVSAGILNIQSNSALGTGLGNSSSGATVTSGATLQMQGGITTTTAVPLTLNGAGVNSKGALENVSGSNTYAGLVTLGAATTIGVDSAADTLTLSNTGTITGAYTLTGTGAGNLTIASNLGIGSGGVIYAGSGIMTLSGSNTFTGGVTINSGTVQVGSAGALNATPGSENAVTFGAGSAGALSLNGNSVAISALNSNATVGSPVVQNANASAATLTIGNSVNLSGSFAGVIQNGAGGALSLIKLGNGTLTLTGSNTYTGTTYVSQGTLTINGASGSLAATSGVTVSGATLNLGDTTNGAAGSINSAAALTLGGNNGGGTVQVFRSGTVFQANVGSLTVGAGYNYATTNVYSGSSGGLNITGAGTNYTRLPGGIYNSANGGGNKSTAFVNTPTGSVIGTGANAMLIGALASGGGFGFVSATSGAIAGLGTTNDSYASGVNTTLTTDTTLASGTTQSLLFTSNVAKTLKLNGPFTVESGGIILGQGLTGVGTISGTGSLKASSGQDLWIGVGVNGGICGLSTISATIADDGASTGLTKFGSGTLLLSGSNTFSGPIFLDSGVLAVGNANALGQGTANLNFLGSATFGASVTLQASGVDFTSARNVVIGGAITSAVIDTNGQNVTLSGLISASGTPSNTGVGALVKMSLGTLTLNGSVVNTYNGSTAVNGGTLKLDFANLATPTNLLGNSTSLVLGGGTLSILGKSTGTTSQTLSNLTLNANTGSGIVLNPNGGSGTTLTFAGNVARNTGSTLNVDLSAGGTLATNLAAGTLGYATVTDATGTGFAKATGSALQRLATFTPLVAASNASATDFTSNPAGSSVTGSPYLTMASSFAANTLTIDTTNATGANFLDLGAASNVLTMTQKGLLMLGGNDFTIQDGQVGAAATETILHTMGAGTLTLATTVGSGAGSLTKNGTGTLLLAGANTYTGATAINAGLVKAGVDSVSTTSGALGTSGGGTVTVGLGAALDFNGHVVNKNLNLNGSGISGGGVLTNSSSTAGSSTGTITLAGSTTIVSAGSGGLTLGGNITDNGYALAVDGAGATTLSGIISGLGSLIKNGAGTLTLSGSNTFSGGITLNSGTLALGNASALGNTGNIVSINGGMVDVALNSAVTTTVGTLLVNNDFATTSSGGASGAWTAAAPVTLGNNVTLTANAAGGTTFSGVISDGTNGYSFTKSGTGTLTLTGANTYSGVTTVNSGRLVFVNDHSGSNNFALNGGTLEFSSTNGNLQLSSGTLSGSGTLVKSGTASMLLGASGQVQSISLTGGLIDVQAGTLRNEFSNGNWTNNKASLNVASGAIVDLWDNVSGITVDALTGSGTVQHTSYGGSAENLTVGVNNGTGTFTGNITNTTGYVLNLVKSGTGTQILSGSNGYTGTTTVNGGTLQIGNGATGSISTTGAVTVNAGGTLALNLANSGTLGNQINISGGVVNMIGSGTNTLSGYLGGFPSGVMNQSGTGTTVITGANYFYGTTNINAGLLVLGSQNAAYDSTVNVGVDNSLVFGANAVTIGALSGSGAVVLANGTNAFTLTAGANNGNTTYSGILSGSGSFVKNGTGTLTLTASSTYTGSTTITGGTLALNPGLSFGGTSSGIISVAGGALSIPSGATLTTALGGISVSSNGVIYLENGGTINAYSSSSVSMNAYINGATVWNTSGRLTSSGTGIGGVLDLHNAAFYVCNINSGNYQFTIDNVTVQNIGDFEVDRGGSGHVVTLQNGAQLFAKSMTVAVDSSNDTLNVTSNSVLNLGGGALNMHGGGGNNSILNINGGTVTNVGAVSFAVGVSSRLASTLVISNSGQLSSTQNSDVNCVSGTATITGTGSLWNMNGKTLTIGSAVTTGTNSGQGNSLTVANGGRISTGGLVLGSTNNWVTFDGGTLTAGTSGNLISGSGYANIRSGGAIIDTGTFNATVASTMVEDATSTGGGLTKSGAGTLSLTAANTFTGATTANGGTLKLVNSQALQNSTLSVGAGAVVFDSSVSSHAFSVGGLSGTGNLILRDNATTPNPVALTAGANNGSSTYSGVLSGSGSLTKAGAGTLGLSAANTFTGSTNINGGTLQLGVGGTSGALSPSSVITNNGTLAFNRSDTMTQGTDFAASIAGSGSVTQVGLGTTVLSASNSYSGGTTISAGVLSIGADTALGAVSGTVAVNGTGTLQTTATFDFDAARNLVIVSGTGTIDTQANTNTVNGAVSGAGVLAKSGGGTLILSGSVAIGGLTVNNGALQLGQSGTVGALSISASGTLAMTANNVNSAKVLDTSALSIATGGTLDLWDNALIVRDQTGGINQGTNLSTIQGLVNTAFDNGAWDKPGITSSTVIADLGAYSVLTVMVYDNTVLGIDSFEGINGLLTDNGGNQVMLKTTYLGDFDGNGIVNSADYGWLDFYYGYGLTVGDLNGDGQVNSADYNGIDYGYGYQAYGVLAGGAATPAASAASAAAPASPEAVPEPGTLGLLLAGALGLFGFRRKNVLRS